MRGNSAKVKPVPREVDIVDLAHDGRGIARVEGKVLFVPDALPGERVRIEQRRVNRHFDEGHLLEILQASPHRVKPQCSHFGLCGGCVLQHCSIEAQLQFKQQHLAENLQRIGKVTPEQWLPPLTGPAWGYRRRARLGVKHVPQKGRVLVGFRERASAFLAALDRCEVVDPRVGHQLLDLSALIGTLSLRDKIPQIEVAVADNALALVFRVLQPPTSQDVEKLLAYGQAHQCWIYLQTGGLDSIRPLRADTPRLHYELPRHQVSIEFEPADFIQVNGAVNADMIDLALQLLQPKSGDRVLELFCGLGNFSLPLARQVAQVTAVEGEAGLVERARQNAQRNGVDNAQFHRGDLFTTSDAPWLQTPFDLLLLDPPRAGAQEILPLAAARKPRRIVYVSCHPGTLARDAGVLVEKFGYRLSQAGVMDMFPHTHHVESIALFER